MELILILQNICGVILILKLVLRETSKKILQYLTKFYLVNIAIILILNVSLEEKRGIELVLKRYFSWNCVTQILKLVLILQNASSPYWNWYWYCKILWGSIEIDIDIAKCIGGVLKLILILYYYYHPTRAALGITPLSINTRGTLSWLVATRDESWYLGV